MDPEEIKKDLNKILELTSKRDSEDDIENSSAALEEYQNSATTLKDIKVPSAHAILAEQEMLKQYRESRVVHDDWHDSEGTSDGLVEKKESPLEKFTSLVMAVTQHDAYNEDDDDEFIKGPSLPREASETTLKALSNVDIEVGTSTENDNLEVRWDLTNVEEFNSEISTNTEERKDVELELELQVKVKSESDLNAITEAVSY
jgi:hypothetical protein